MSSDALPLARKHQRGNLAGFTALAVLLLSLAILSACTMLSQGGNSNQNQGQNPQLSGNLGQATVGVAYNGTLSVSGGKAPYAFTINAGSLPTGLSLAASSGTISGMPGKAGNFNFTIQVTDTNNLQALQGFQIIVITPGQVTVNISPLATSVTSAGTVQFTANVGGTTNTAVTWSATKGTVSSSGLYTAPAVTSTTTATVTATSVADTTISAQATVTITTTTVTQLSITTSSLAAATADSSYSATLSATGGTAPYSWSIATGALPTGISLTTGGAISGTTNQMGQFAFTAEVSDSATQKQTVTRLLTLTVNASNGGNNIAPSTLFGFTTTDTSTQNYPTVNYSLQRFWDSPPLQWPSINTASGVYDFSNLDSTLALAYTSGVTTGMYTLARTPPWATSNPNDTSCYYTTATSGGGNGECDPPNDLNSDGTGPNAIWKAWITAIATHVNSPSYLQTHAHIQYWEIWNEPDSQSFWNGSFAQLARLTEDANCIITGRGVIHESGNGTATACTATPIDRTAKIVMASGHATGSLLTYAQNHLYCNASPTGYQLPCPIPGNAVASAIDIVNFHMKPGNQQGNTCPPPTACTPESAMQLYISSIEGMLQPAELAKPLWNGEASYAEAGFTGAYTDPDMAASFMSRIYLIDWSLGIQGIAWYDWSNLQNQPAQVQTAYQQTYNWLAGSSLLTPCAASGTVWSCTINRSGIQYLILWDSAQSCSNGVCTTSNQTVGSLWSQYQDMTSASTATSISGHLVPVGIKPVILH